GQGPDPESRRQPEGVEDLAERGVRGLGQAVEAVDAAVVPGQGAGGVDVAVARPAADADVPRGAFPRLAVVHGGGDALAGAVGELAEEQAAGAELAHPAAEFGVGFTAAWHVWSRRVNGGRHAPPAGARRLVPSLMDCKGALAEEID